MNFSFIPGLCGAVHTGVARYIRNELAQDPNTMVICVGDKSRAILQRLYSKNILLVANEVICFLTICEYEIKFNSFLGWTFATTILRCF